MILQFSLADEISYLRYYANEKDFIANVPMKATNRRGYDHLTAYFNDRNLPVKLEYYISNGSLKKREIMEYNSESQQRFVIKRNGIKQRFYFDKITTRLENLLSDEEKTISNVRGNIIPTITLDGIEIPTEITKNGWIFDPKNGTQIQGKYIFGEKPSINENELKFLLNSNNIQTKKTESDELIIVVIIAIISIGAAIFYLKGYKK